MREPKKNTSKDRAALFIKAALEALHAAGGSLPLREVKAAVAAILNSYTFYSVLCSLRYNFL
jgi:hypothetical protein